jgi:hypothetical protein
VYGLSAGLDDGLSAWSVIREFDHLRLLVREPLARQSWPIQSMRDNQIIQVGCVFFPRVESRINYPRKSTRSVVRTMSCIPVIVLARHWLYLRRVGMYLVN